MRFGGFIITVYTETDTLYQHKNIKKEISTIISKTKKEIIMYSNNVFLCVKILANRLFDLIIVMIAFNDLHTRKNFFYNCESLGCFVARS